MGRIRRQRDVSGRFVKGNAAALRHGGFSSSSKDIPLRVRRQVQALREQIIREKGPALEDINAVDLIRIEKACNVYLVTMAMEAFISREGIFKGKKLELCLRENYLAYVNSLRLLLRDLDLSENATARVLSPLEVAAEIDRQKAGAQVGPLSARAGQTSRDGEIARPTRSESEIHDGPGDGPGEE